MAGPFPSWSIRHKLMLAIMLTSSTAVLLTALAMIGYEHTRLRRATETELRLSAGLIAKSAASALAFGDAAAASDTLQALWVRRDIVHACLYTADGRLFVEYDPQNRFGPSKPLPGGVEFGDHAASLCQPVQLGNDLAGFVYVRSDLQPQLLQLRRHLYIALGIIAAALVVAFVFSFQLQQFIAGPLLALTDAARAVVTRKDYGVRVARPGSDETGKLTDAFNQMLDEIARHETELAASEERYRLLVESAPEGISVCVGDRVAFINEHGVRMFGARGASEIVGRSLFGFLHPDSHRVVMERMAQLTEQRKAVPLMEQKFLRLDGAVFDAEMIAVPITYQGQPAIQAFFRDITERKKAEQALAESRRFNERIVETVPDLVYVFDLVAQRNVYINREIHRVLGLSAEQFQAEALARLVHPADALRLAAHFACLAVARDDEVLETTCRFHDAAGQWRWLQMRDTVFTRLSDGSVHQIIGAAADITARREMEREILDISECEHARIGQDIHDGLCQQLVGVRLAVKLFQEKLRARNNEESKEVEEISRLVLEATNQARAISRALYPVRLLEEGLSVSLQQLAIQTSEMFMVQCVAECDGVLSSSDVSVSLHLYRIAQEALNNAVKHAKPKRITIKLKADDRFMFLSVQDDGVGIQQNVDRGAGMGLRIMRYRAHMIGGNLTVSPAEGGGTVVTCRCLVPE